MLLSIVTYFFAVIAVDYIASDPKLQSIVFDTVTGKTVADRFSNLPRSLLSLFEFFSLDNISSKGYDIINARPVTFLFFLAFALIVPIVS